MIAATDFQRAIISKLQANITLVALLDAATSIKEDFYRGTIYNYPAVRVDVEYIMPRDVSCEDQYTGRFTVIIASESDSSNQCARIQKAVIDALFTKKLSLATVFTSGAIQLKANPAPMFIEDEDYRVWQGHCTFDCSLTEL